RNKATITTNSIRSALTAGRQSARAAAVRGARSENGLRSLFLRDCVAEKDYWPRFSRMFTCTNDCQDRLVVSAGASRQLTSCERGQPIVEDQRPHQEHDGCDNHPARPVGRETQSIQ